MKRGYLETAKFLVQEYLVPRKIDILSEMRQANLKIKQEMDKTARIFNNIENMQTLAPVHRWGQNDTHVLISVKFAHRWSSPGCLDTWNQTLSVYSSVSDYVKDFDIVSTSKNFCRLS